jgi:hypothetical protein
MKKIAFGALLFVLLSTTAFAQSISKSLAFAQIAAGGSSPEIWETILNITNRGTTTYTGIFTLYTMSNGNPQPWSPIVSGNAITNGQMNISLGAGDTTSLTITGSEKTVSGIGTIAPTGSSSTDGTSFVEGTLTYYVLSGGNVSDSIGILPSDSIYLSTVPFDNFSTICFALANTNATAASIQLNLYSDSGQELGTQTVTIQPNGQVAEYLWQAFTNFSQTSSFVGRLDIESLSPIIGVVLTDVNNQFSSLPFLPTVLTANWTASLQTQVRTGTVVFRFSGSQGEIQATLLTKNGNPVANPHSGYAVGTFNAGNYSAYNVDPILNEISYWSIPSFSLSTQTIEGTLEIWTINGQTVTYLGQGTITLTAANSDFTHSRQV